MLRQIVALLALHAVGCSAFLASAPLRPASAVKARSAAVLSLSMDDAVILQNKGGGHGEIGFHLARQLRAKGLGVTILQDAAAKDDKPPFSSYGELVAEGVQIYKIPLDDPAAIQNALAGQVYTHVFDNYAKNKDTVATAAGLARQWNVKNYAYVSSAGMYKPDVDQPMVETAANKETGQFEVECYLRDMGLPYSAFRPQYIYGPKTNKRDYLDWFFDRIVRGAPCPLPNSGNQKASITHCEDVAGMLSSVVGNEGAAAGQVFNCGTDLCHTYAEVCGMVGNVVGKSPQIVTYDPKKFDLPKGAFPFRNDAFYVTPDKAKALLGWQRKHSLGEDLPWYYQSYLDAGLHTKEKVFEADATILGSMV